MYLLTSQYLQLLARIKRTFYYKRFAYVVLKLFNIEY